LLDQAVKNAIQLAQRHVPEIPESFFKVPPKVVAVTGSLD
jgi:hypothetical protein